MTQTMHYCPNCGAPIERKVPPGDDRPRDVCSRDGEIFYHNPLAVVGCIAEFEGRILLCRRAIEPRSGFWTLPAGFLELGETCADAGRRETREEAMADVEVGALFALINVSHIGQMHMFYLARMHSAACAPGQESAATALFEEHEIPWRQLAFPSIHVALERYFDDRRRGQFGMHDIALARDSWKQMRLAREPEDSLR